MPAGLPVPIFHRACVKGGRALVVLGDPGSGHLGIARSVSNLARTVEQTGTRTHRPRVLLASTVHPATDRGAHSTESGQTGSSAVVDKIMVLWVKPPYSQPMKPERN